MGTLEWRTRALSCAACAALLLPRVAQAAGESPEEEAMPEGSRAVHMPSGAYFAPDEHATFTVAPAIGLQGGTETYEFHASIPDAAGLDASASSKLTYPVSAFVAGGSLFFGTGPLGLSATLLTNTGDPWGTLLDQDFISASDGTTSQTVEFSHTDSSTTLRMFDAEAAARLRLGRPAPGKTTALHLVAGFHFESSVYDAYGASGWQLDSNEARILVSVPGDPHALRYELRYYQPFLGVGLDVGRGEPFALSGEARLIASWSTHDDDHLLRHKLARASAFGGGIGLRLDPMYSLGGWPGLRFYAGATAQLAIVSSFTGRLRQHYYADDPSIDGDQTGAQIPDAAFSFISVRARLLAVLAARF